MLIVPWFDEEVPLLRMLTDRGAEYCGKKETYACQLYLKLEDIEYSETRAYSPQTNGICGRFHKTMKNDCYDVMFRRKLSHSLELGRNPAIQQEVDRWLTFYNQERAHSGKYCYGKTPWQTWLDAKALAKDKQLDNLFVSSDNQTHLTNSMV
ncbi:integrase core domain-containing protein [Nitrosomonas sp. Is37]|nr:integrase core domain-containing protein [Nitrosomonas sp. Is37]